MRIVQVSTLYPPELFSGGTLACHHVATALQRRGHEVSVFAGSCRMGEPALLEKQWVYEGIPVHAVNVMQGYAQGLPNYRNVAVAERFARYLARVQPDVVHFHCLQALGADMLAVPRDVGSPSVITMHDGWFACPRQFMFTGPPRDRMCPLRVDPTACDCMPGFDFVGRRRFLDGALAPIDRVLAVSAPFADVLRENGIGDGKLVVCENGVAPASPLPHVPSRRVRFGHLAGADGWKGASTIARALPLVDADLEVQLHGTEAEDWTAMGGRADRRVRLLPRFAPSRLPHILANVDVVLITSLGMETFSIVAREAMQHGLPVIASRSLGPEGIVRDGENGLLYDRGDAEGLASAMRRLAGAPQLLARLRSGASSTLVRTIEEQVSQIEDVYRDVTRARPRRAPAAPPLPRSVLFIGGMDGAPFRYRCTNLVEQMEALGVRATARLHRDEDALAAAGASEVVVLNRLPWDPYTELVVERARAAGALLVFGVDDLIFEPRLDIEALAKLPRHTAKSYRAGLKLFERTLLACDAFLGSTETLAEAARALGKPAFVHGNTLSPELVAISEAARAAAAAERAASAARPVRLGYFSGSYAHDRDFAVAAPALARVLAARPDVHLVLGGHLGVPDVLERFERRIERLPFVSWRELPAHLAGLDVNLAPLTTPSRFNEAKSALKWFEAAAAGVATVASPTGPFREAIRHGVDGMLAATTDEWEAALTALVDDGALRSRIADAARAEALSRYAHERAVAALDGTLREMMRLARGPLRTLPPISDVELAGLRARRVGIGRPAVEPRDAVAGPSQLAAGTITPRLGGAVAAYQPLFLPDGRLSRIDLLVGTYGRVHRYDLVLRLVDQGSGEEVARAVVPAEHACDNSWVAFDFDDVPVHAGREMLLVLEAPGAPRRQGLSVYCEFLGWPSGAAWCGRIQGITLAHRTWLRRPGAAPQPRPSAVEARLALAEERLARALTRRSWVSEAASRTSAWRTMERLLDAADGPGPSLPHRAVRKTLAMLNRGASDEDVGEVMEKVRATLPYRAARRIYRGLRRR